MCALGQLRGVSCCNRLQLLVVTRSVAQKIVTFTLHCTNYLLRSSLTEQTRFNFICVEELIA